MDERWTTVDHSRGGGTTPDASASAAGVPLGSTPPLREEVREGSGDQTGGVTTHEVRREGGRGEMSAREQFDRGCAMLDGGDPQAALVHLRVAFEQDGHDSRVRSCYGLCVGLVERRFEEAVSLCQSAAKQEFFNPDLYFNLARLHLGFGFKAEGVRYLRRGLMIDPSHEAIQQALRELGDRCAPVLGFLPRRHPVNRWLGAVRHTIATHRPLRWAT